MPIHRKVIIRPWKSELDLYNLPFSPGAMLIGTKESRRPFGTSIGIGNKMNGLKGHIKAEKGQ